MKILIVYATAGAGHRRAAEAIYNAAVKDSSHRVALVDSLDYTNPVFRKIYSEGYRLLITYIPSLWAFLYYVLDNRFIYGLVHLLRRPLTYWNARGFIRYLTEEKFDVIVSTQFFANEVLDIVKQKKLCNPRVIGIITDFALHSFWLSGAIDTYVVASLQTKVDLILRGVAEHKIKTLGIPVDGKFLEPFNKDELCARFGIRQDIFTCLIMTGAVGIGPIEQIVERLKDNVQLLVVCGANKRLYESLKRKEAPTVKVFGLVKNVHELMTVSDCVITKPGGMSISEALIKHLPMIFIAAIPGQETRNARFIIERGVGAQPRSVSGLVQLVRTWQNSPRHFSDIKEHVKQLSYPYVTSEIIKLFS